MPAWDSTFISMRSVGFAIMLMCGHALAAPQAPMRPLPVATSRAAPTGSVLHVDARKGTDTGDGTASKPWKTIGRALRSLKPGDTLYLHAGVYFDTPVLQLSGTPASPITIRSAPNELAVIDGGIREFEENPRTAWEPVSGGEFRSTASFPNISRTSDGGRGVWILGNFADSLIPLHGYKFPVDLRATNEYWNVPNKLE